MAYYAQTNGKVIATSTAIANPGVYYPAPVATCPQAYSVSQQQPPASGKYGAPFDRVTSIWLGALLICCGVVSLVGAGLAFGYVAYYYELGTGLWCGAMFISAGAVGIAAGLRGTDSLIKGVTASGVLTVGFGTTQVTMAALGICHDEDGYWHGGQDDKTYALTANGMLTAAASLAIIFGIWLFAVGCKALCTCCPHNPAQVVSAPVQYVQYPQQATASTHQPPVVALFVTQTNENHEPPKYAEQKHN